MFIISRHERRCVPVLDNGERNGIAKVVLGMAWLLTGDDTIQVMEKERDRNHVERLLSAQIE